MESGGAEIHLGNRRGGDLHECEERQLKREKVER